MQMSQIKTFLDAIVKKTNGHLMYLASMPSLILEYPVYSKPFSQCILKSP